MTKSLLAIAILTLLAASSAVAQELAANRVRIAMANKDLVM